VALQLAEQEDRNKASGQLDIFSLAADGDGEESAADSEYQVNYIVVPEWPDEEKLKNEKVFRFLSQRPSYGKIFSRA